MVYCPAENQSRFQWSDVVRIRKPVVAFFFAMIVAVAAQAQTGHPAKGSWLGYWGPDTDERRRMRLLLDWENRTVIGTINPGRNGVPIHRG
jgi:hypothetical protein